MTFRWPWERRKVRDPDPLLVEAEHRAEVVVERAERVTSELAERRRRNNFAEGLGFRPAPRHRTTGAHS